MDAGAPGATPALADLFRFNGPREGPSELPPTPSARAALRLRLSLLAPAGLMPGSAHTREGQRGKGPQGALVSNSRVKGPRQQLTCTQGAPLSAEGPTWSVLPQQELVLVLLQVSRVPVLPCGPAPFLPSSLARPDSKACLCGQGCCASQAVCLPIGGALPGDAAAAQGQHARVRPDLAQPHRAPGGRMAQEEDGGSLGPCSWYRGRLWWCCGGTPTPVCAGSEGAPQAVAAAHAAFDDRVGKVLRPEATCVATE